MMLQAVSSRTVAQQVSALPDAPMPPRVLTAQAQTPPPVLAPPQSRFPC